MSDKKNERDIVTQMVDAIAKRPEDAKNPAEKERIAFPPSPRTVI